MKKIILFLAIFASIMRAEFPNQDLIKIHAKLYPQILLFSENVQKSDSPITIAVLYSNNTSRQIADSFKNSVDEIYKNSIKNRHLNVISISCQDFTKLQHTPTAVYIVDCEQINIKTLNKFISMSATKNTFDSNNALFYVEITQKTNILFNKKVAKNPNFAFSPSLLKLVTITETE